MIFELIARISFFFSRRAAARRSISPSCFPEKSFYFILFVDANLTSYYLRPRVAPASMAPLNPCREFVRNSRVVAAESRECEIIKWNSSSSRIIRYIESFDSINLVKVHHPLIRLVFLESTSSPSNIYFHDRFSRFSKLLNLNNQINRFSAFS